ncbi:hypothetical protein [Chenggangzhangella methanolivorans]|uniref:Flagellar basal-body protein FlbY n=1 Tax=Chenggangzhangella methanolivorans TaxID=1437009 RepID=A0A9E6UNE7_9HYPH|nr:hypothetical protein [Chenggangzhangella methanolivorans]QZO01006.1 hypothetical protein K6K41_05195 [Chenggangzhangella methanolivorans]
MTLRRRSVPAVVARAPMTPQEAAERISRIAGTVERLTAVIAEETRLVRVGAYGAANELASEKAELSGRYMLDVEGLRAQEQAVAAQDAGAIGEVSELHVAFRAALEENLLVIGTARSVAESLLRGVAEEMGSKSQPSVYDRTGGGYGKPAAAAPIAVSRGA